MPQSIQLSVSDHSDIGALQARLREVPGAEITRTAARSAPGEQGALDVLTALGATSSVLVAVVRVIPGYLRARRAGISVTTTVNGKDFTLTSEDADKVMPIIERLLQDE
jgi:hypothetical protein